MKAALARVLGIGAKEWFVFLQKSAVVQVILGSLFLGLLAQIRIPLFFTPVPITGQTLAVMLLGVTLGSKRGALAVLCYFAQGTFGMPVWAGGGFGLQSVAGPTGGYIVGFVIQAYLTGYLIERMKTYSCARTFSLILIASLIQLAMGTLWLAQFVGWGNAPILGFYPFLLGDVIKVGVATAVTKVYGKRLV